MDYIASEVIYCRSCYRRTEPDQRQTFKGIVLCLKCCELLTISCKICNSMIKDNWSIINDDIEHEFLYNIGTIRETQFCMKCADKITKDKVCSYCKGKLHILDADTFHKQQYCQTCFDIMNRKCTRCHTLPTICDFECIKEDGYCQSCMETRLHGCIQCSTKVEYVEPKDLSSISDDEYKIYKKVNRVFREFLRTGLCINCVINYEETINYEFPETCQACSEQSISWKSSSVVQTYTLKILLSEKNNKQSLVSLFPDDLIEYITKFQYSIRDILRFEPFWPEQFTFTFQSLRICPTCHIKLPEVCKACQKIFVKDDMKTAVPTGLCQSCSIAITHLCPKCHYVIDGQSRSSYFDCGVCCRCLPQIKNSQCPNCHKTIISNSDIKNIGHHNLCLDCYNYRFNNECIDALPNFDD